MAFKLVKLANDDNNPSPSSSIPEGEDMGEDILTSLDVIDSLIEDSQGEIDPAKDQIPVQFITGSAGTGKTFRQQQLIAADPAYGILCATTGVAAINLGSITLNSILRYFDTESLEDAFVSGRLNTILAQLAREKRNLVIDEVSMLDADQLDLIYEAAIQVSKYRTLRHPLGIVLTGDFCQLPPVNAKWAFEAQCWPAFARHTTRLTQSYRQVDLKFIEALNHARAGRGASAAEMLYKSGVNFTNRLDTDFQGTTIVAKNSEVERYNRIALARVKGADIPIQATRWGKQRSEWIWKEARQTGIPDRATIRVNSLVMILANDPPTFSFVNGDLGYVRDYDAANEQFVIELLRNKALVRVGRIERTLAQRRAPADFSDPWSKEEAEEVARKNRPQELPYYDWEKRQWILGSITYYPLRAGYAVTVHKAQGLTLDRVQIDCREHFFGSPNMAYVALSRVRTPGGLYIVSPPEILSKRIKVAPEVAQWI
jgi:ATP-dependent DNA helicase PIF1